jgi:hypothetical protein
MTQTYLPPLFRQATFIKPGFEVKTDDSLWVRVTAIETTPPSNQMVIKLSDGSFFTADPSDEVMCQRWGGAS